MDDHCTYRLLLGSLLKKLGVAHRCCSDGEQALRALSHEHFDLVISDCRMPVMDGYTLTRELRRREQAERREPITVLGLTGSLQPEDIRQCVACGMDGWLIKPIGFAQLREVLRFWLPPPQTSASANGRAGLSGVGKGPLPTRASLIDAFGSWEVVEPMLFSLIQEAHADLGVLLHAQTVRDAKSAAQCLHRLIGSVAFLGETSLEAHTVDLIKRVQLTGVELNQSALDDFFRDVERYLNYLAHL
ncbi:response regulator [Pseudomonas kairouanensis]|uniref:response regulator n=1 Tax=Pseudomonas kairouanensis TaxID=2293832 RepID=UPI001EE37A28|nr:response regulator [Pseudomonas kairouanensis]